MFGVILGFFIFEYIEGYEKIIQIICKNKKIFMDKLEIKFVFEMGEIKCLDKIVCQSNGKLWIVGNEGFLKLF